ncbi:MAG: hypothetical protein JOZ40_00145 [Methylobacteriaceae bacterium]|nr:hypothetical protein [Methylobacteriaceae bacterium]
MDTGIARSALEARSEFTETTLITAGTLINAAKATLRRVIIGEVRPMPCIAGPPDQGVIDRTENAQCTADVPDPTKRSG